MRRLSTAPKLFDFIRQIPSVNTWLSTVSDRLNLYQGAVDPTLAEVPNNQWVVYKNTTSGEVRLWVNDNGTLKKSVALT